MISYYQSTRYSVRMKDKLCNICDYVTNKTSHLKRHFKADCVPENRANYDILLNSLDLHNISDDFQIVCDFKLINILIGIQTCASRYSCPFCIGCKLDSEGNFSTRKGTYTKGAMRTCTPQLNMNMSHLAIESSVKNILSNFIR